jgi:hypothetical protein
MSSTNIASKSTRRRFAGNKTIVASAAVVATAHELAAPAEVPAPATPPPEVSTPEPAPAPIESVSGSSQSADKLLTREQVGKLAGEKITSSTVKIVDAVIEQAEKGNYLHAKFLVEFAGITATPEQVRSAEDSLAAILLRGLDIRAQNLRRAADAPDADPPSVE